MAHFNKFHGTIPGVSFVLSAHWLEYNWAVAPNEMTETTLLVNIHRRYTENTPPVYYFAAQCKIHHYCEILQQHRFVENKVILNNV